MPRAVASPIRVLRAGRTALGILRRTVRPTSIAAFERSAYVEDVAGNVACIGCEDIGDGPLNALCTAPAWAQAEIVVGEPLDVDCSQATGWAPLAPGTVPEAPRLAARADAYAGLAAARAPADGFARLVLDPATAPDTPLARRALDGIAALDAWLRAPYTRPAEACERLIGLGPGLTPSGDDLLGGACIALHALRFDDRAAVLRAWLEPRLDARTSRISAAHVRAALAGEGAAVLHACLAALCSPAPIDDASLEAIGHHGHTSGWDALAGVLLAVRAATGGR